MDTYHQLGWRWGPPRPRTYREQIKMDYVKLVKLLRMTEGSFDGECLNAIRMANAMLMEDNLNWEELFQKIVMEASRQSVPQQQAKPKGTVYTDDKEINTYFEAIFKSKPKGSFKTFVESVHDWWIEKGFLTERQYEVIKKSGTKAWSDI